MFVKILMALIAFNSFSIEEKKENTAVSSQILFIRQGEVLNAFSSYKALIKRLQELIKKLDQSRTRFNEYAQKTQAELMEMSKKIQANQTNLKVSAALMKDFENRKNQIEKEFSKIQKEVAKAEQEVNNHRAIISKWLGRFEGKDVLALKKIVEKRKNISAVLFSDNALFVANSADITQEYIKELKKLLSDK